MRGGESLPAQAVGPGLRIVKHRREGAHRKRAERAHLGRHGIEFETLRGQRSETSHVLDDGNFVTEEDRMNRPMQIRVSSTL